MPHRNRSLLVVDKEKRENEAAYFIDVSTSSPAALDAARAIHTVTSTAMIVTKIAYVRFAGMLLGLPKKYVMIARIAWFHARPATNANAVVTRPAVTLMYSALLTKIFTSFSLTLSAPIIRR